MVALATAATVIASQATISGAFSMAQQAALLGLSPRVRVTHTSASEHGQIYVPAINWMQLIGVVLLVLSFKSSTNLAAAYGIAVTGTMLVTTLLVFVLAVRAWKWSWPLAIVVLGSFGVIDATLMSANMVKFWGRLGAAGTRRRDLHRHEPWMKGRTQSPRGGRARCRGDLLSSISQARASPGTAVYLTAFSGSTPACCNSAQRCCTSRSCC
jgi:KUP system potassium uptake protein